MSNSVIGKVIEVGEVLTFSSGFTKRQIVVETNDKYPQKVPFEVVKDMCLDSSVASLREGDEVEVQYNLRGNEYQGKYYLSAQAWRIDKSGQPKTSSSKKQAQPQNRASKTQSAAQTQATVEDFEDSPF